MIISTLAAMTAGYLLSVMFGTPKVLSAERLISALCSKLAPKFSGKYQDGEDAQHTGGVFYIIIVLLIVLIPTAVILLLLYWKIPAVAILLDALLCWSANDIKRNSKLAQAAARSVRSGNYIKGTRCSAALSRMSLEELEGEDIVRASVQGSADRAVDCAAAPLIYMALLSGVGGVLFRAVDAAASADAGDAFLSPARKLREALCFIPGKLAAVIMLVDALFLKLDTRGGERTMKLDSKKCSRRAFGSCRAVLAGVLGISLLPEEVYTAQFMRSFTIGEQLADPEAKDITLANQLMLGTAFIIMVLLFMIKLTVGVFVR